MDDYLGWEEYFVSDALKHPIWSWVEGRSNFQDPIFIAYIDEIYGLEAEDKK